jgi:hypothetical protein
LPIWCRSASAIWVWLAVARPVRARRTSPGAPSRGSVARVWCDRRVLVDYGAGHPLDHAVRPRRLKRLRARPPPAAPRAWLSRRSARRRDQHAVNGSLEAASRLRQLIHVHMIEAAHNQEVAGSILPPLLGKAPDTGPFSLVIYSRAAPDGQVSAVR